MHRLLDLAHYRQVFNAMTSALFESVQQPNPPLPLEPAIESETKPLDVNVIFTGAEQTRAALKAAVEFGNGLRIRVHIWAAIVVPMRVSLDAPLVSVTFFERQLQEIAAGSMLDASEREIHLYICRNWIVTLLHVVKKNSVVLLGGRKLWWHTQTMRMASALQAHGYRVAWIDTKRQPKLAKHFV
jgi:hypothetical protein